MDSETHRFLSSLISCGGSSFRKGLPSATRAQDKARQAAKRQGFVSYDDLRGWSITGRGRDALEAKDHPMPTDQTTTPTVSEARFEEAFENYRRQKFSAYGDYPIEAYTYFSAGWNAALRAMPEAQGWRPIESAPKDGARIALWDFRTGYVPWVYWDKAQEIWVSEVMRWGGRPTHWMPLPAPPEVK